MSSPEVVGDDIGKRAALALESLLSPIALSRATDVGERVSAFGLENILTSTDFLHTLAKRAQAGDTSSELILRQLASSSTSHVDYVDRAVTQVLTEIALTPGGIKLIPEDRRSHMAGITDDNLRLISRAKVNVAGSKAMTTTVSIADPRYLTQRNLDYLYNTPEALRQVQIEDQLQAVVGSSSPLITGGLRPETRGTVKFSADAAGAPSYVFQPSRPGSTAIPIADSIATNYIKNELNAIRSMSGDPDAIIAPGAPTRTSVVKTLGISPIQQANIEYTGRFLATGTASSISTGNILDISRSIASNEDAFFKGMTATGNITGFTFGLSPQGRTGVYETVRHPLQALAQSRMESYQKALYESGIVAASMQPEVRSAVVSLSAITAPIGTKNTQFISGALAHETDATGVLVERSAEDVASRVAASSDLISRNLPLLSETGIVFTQAQKALSVGDTVTAIPYEILKEMKTIDDSGAEMLLTERLKGEGANRSAKVRLSRATRSETTTPTVNVIYGGTLGKQASEIEVRRATFEAEQFIKITKAKIEGKTPQEMIAAGFATSEEHFQRIQAAINDPKAIEKETRKRLERGFTISTLDPSVDEGSRSIATQAAEIIDNLSGGIDSDIDLEQKGMSFTVGQIGEEGAVLTPRLSDEVTSELNRVGTALGRDVLERSSSTRQVGLLQGAIRRGVDTSGEDGGGFFGRLRAFARSVRPDAEIAGSSISTARKFRDMDIEERMKFLKPKIFKGAGAVAALSAGYYLATRSRKNSLYNETMEQQEFEPGPMSIQDFNQIDQQLAAQSSSRRDPLVTAGVVGNLDRNKTSHYKMGPGKYNHLYGG